MGECLKDGTRNCCIIGTCRQSHYCRLQSKSRLILEHERYCGGSRNGKWETRGQVDFLEHALRPCEWRGIGGAVIARLLCHRLCRILCQLEHHSTTTSSHLRHRQQFTFACTIVWNAKLHTLQAFIAAGRRAIGRWLFSQPPGATMDHLVFLISGDNAAREGANRTLAKSK